MKKIPLLNILIALVLAVSASAAPRPLRVLFLGHESEHHNSGKYLPILMANVGRDAIYFDYFTQPDCLNADTLSHYDAVMLYANHTAMKPEQFEPLKEFVESGHGFLPIHCASACFGNEPRFIALVGGRFKEHQTGVFKAAIVSKTHPVMQGVNEYETWDETYVHDQINTQGRTLLAERVDGTHREPWTWVRDQGKGRVFYTASGHDERTWKNADFQKMLRNAIVWAVGDKAKAEWETFLAQREPEKREANPNVANYEKRPEPLTFQLPMSVKGSMERTQVPADMKLQLFASEPDIRKPIAMAWDDRGRLWICETSDYPHGVKTDGMGNDSIRICEDTNGDGKADKFTVFADHLNIPTGIVFANGGVIVSQPPRFLFLKDSNGDDKADIRQDVITGWGIADTHAQASNLHYGYDNWLHGCVGYSGYDGTVGGVKRKFSMGTYRFRADGSALEFLHQFTNNSWGQSQNAAGDDFGGTANGAPIFYGGIPASAFPDGVKGMSAKKINLVAEAHTITPNFRQVDVMGGYTAAAGSSFVYSGNLPARLQGKAMVCEPTMKLVSLMDVRANGAGYDAHDSFNILASSDEWLSPVCAEVGPDGAIWIADFQNFIIQHNPTPSVERGGYAAKTGVGGAHENPLRDHERGRIYRVIWDKAKAPAITSLKGASDEALVKALGSDTQFWRLRAQELLVEKKAVAVAPALKKIVAANDSGVAAIHALWTLQGLGQLDEATHRSALLAKDGALRRNAVRAVSNDPKSLALLFGSGAINDSDLNTRLATFVKLAAFQTTPELKTLVSKLGADPVVAKDEWLKEGVRLLGKKHGGTAYADGPNLLPNSGLETVGTDGMPEGWKRRDYGSREANKSAMWEVVTGPGNVHSGARALRCKTTGAADTSYFANVPLKPNTMYKLSGWVKAGKGIKGKISFNDHIGRAETETVTRGGDWTEVEVTFNSADRTESSINILHVCEGEGIFDDVKLCELLPTNAPADDVVMAGDVKRGEDIFWKHPTAACALCHMLGGKGSTVGPALDGISKRKEAAYIKESLLEPNKVLAEGFQQLGVSPMPPMGLILKPQELADIQAFLQTLK